MPECFEARHTGCLGPCECLLAVRSWWVHDQPKHLKSIIFRYFQAQVEARLTTETWWVGVDSE